MTSVSDIDRKRVALRLLHAPKRPPKRVVKTEDERLQVAFRRAVVAYGEARARFDAGREKPLNEEVAFLLFADLSGEVRVFGDGRKRSIRVLSFHSLEACPCRECGGRSAAELIDSARSALELRCSERDRPGVRSFGDPRRGKRRSA